MFLLCLLLCGCHADQKRDDDTFYLNIKNEVETTIYGFHYEYLLDGEAVGGGVLTNADGSAIAQGEVSIKDFTIKDFPENSDLSKFQIYFYVINEDQSEDEVENVIKIDCHYGESYTVVISGKDHYDVRYQESQ